MKTLKKEIILRWLCNLYRHFLQNNNSSLRFIFKIQYPNTAVHQRNHDSPRLGSKCCIIATIGRYILLAQDEKFNLQCLCLELIFREFGQSWRISRWLRLPHHGIQPAAYLPKRRIIPNWKHCQPPAARFYLPRPHKCRSHHWDDRSRVYAQWMASVYPMEWIVGRAPAGSKEFRWPLRKPLEGSFEQYG